MCDRCRRGLHAAGDSAATPVRLWQQLLCGHDVVLSAGSGGAWGLAPGRERWAVVVTARGVRAETTPSSCCRPIPFRESEDGSYRIRGADARAFITFDRQRQGRAQTAVSAGDRSVPVVDSWPADLWCVRACRVDLALDFFATLGFEVRLAADGWVVLCCDTVRFVFAHGCVEDRSTLARSAPYLWTVDLVDLCRGLFRIGARLVFAVSRRGRFGRGVEPGWHDRVDRSARPDRHSGSTCPRCRLRSPR